MGEQNVKRNVNAIKDKSNVDEVQLIKLDAITIGGFLRDGYRAAKMRDKCEKLLEQNLLYSFEKLPERLKERFAELRPVDKLSYAIVSEKGKPYGYSVISEQEDGTLFLADIKSATEGGMMGLLYMSLAAVFMEMQPNEIFFIPTTDDATRRAIKKIFLAI